MNFASPNSRLQWAVTRLTREMTSAPGSSFHTLFFRPSLKCIFSLDSFSLHEQTLTLPPLPLWSIWAPCVVTCGHCSCRSHVTVELSSHPALSDQSHDSLPNSSGRLNGSNHRLRPLSHSPNGVTQEGRCSRSFLSERFCLLSVDSVSFTLPSRPLLHDRLCNF